MVGYPVTVAIPTYQPCAGVGHALSALARPRPLPDSPPLTNPRTSRVAALRVTEDEDMIMVSGQYVGQVRLTIVR